MSNPNPGPSLRADPKTHPCPFCGGASMMADAPTERTYTCNNCAAVETITKGTNPRAGWWYHGWEAASGAAMRAPTVAEMQAGKYGWQP